MRNQTFTIAAVVSSLFLAHSASAFEGCIHAVITRGNQTAPLLYTVGTNFLRIEVTTTNRPHPVDLWNLRSGGLTLVFPHNRSFVWLPAAVANPAAPARGVPGMPNSAPAMPLPRGVGPQSVSPPGPAGRIGPTNLPGMPAAPAMRQKSGISRPPHLPRRPVGAGMPAMPRMPMPQAKLVLKATAETTNLLGYTCARYELKQRGETMEIWATGQLLPFEPYQRSQPLRFGPRRMEDEWGELLKTKKLFPLVATLKFDNGAMRFRFEVQSITPERLAPADAKLFQPPTNYFRVWPLPF